MRFSPARFNAFLNGAVGQAFAWRRRSACPCADPSSGHASFNCQVCSGKGHIWSTCEEQVVAGQSSQSPQKAIATFGNYERGDCTITIPSDSPMYDAGQYDRIRSLASTNRFSEVVRPGLNDRLLGTIVCVDRVFWLDTDDETVVEGRVPTVDENGALIWEHGSPPAGRNYVIEGTRYDEWFVYIPLVTDRNIGVMGLPRKVAARRFDLLGR